MAPGLERPGPPGPGGATGEDGGRRDDATTGDDATTRRRARALPDLVDDLDGDPQLLGAGQDRHGRLRAARRPAAYGLGGSAAISVIERIGPSDTPAASASCRACSCGLAHRVGAGLGARCAVVGEGEVAAAAPGSASPAAAPAASITAPARSMSRSVAVSRLLTS